MTRKASNQLALFADADAPGEPDKRVERALDRYFDGKPLAVELYAPPVPVSGEWQQKLEQMRSEVIVTPEPPRPEFDCYLHCPPVQSAWYLVQGRWTCAVCYPRLGD